MKRKEFDFHLVIGYLLSHLFMFIIFNNRDIFWYMFASSMLILISYAIFYEKLENELSFFTYSFYGILSGIVIFALFWLGNGFIELLHLPFDKQISKLYTHYSPKMAWQYFILLLIIVPGEELFWRGFIQKRLTDSNGYIKGIIIATIMYASIQIYSGYFIHIFAAIIGGLFWGTLYAWKRSMPLVILSHLIFDIFLFIVFPFR